MPLSRHGIKHLYLTWGNLQKIFLTGYQHVEGAPFFMCLNDYQAYLEISKYILWKVTLRKTKTFFILSLRSTFAKFRISKIERNPFPASVPGHLIHYTPGELFSNTSSVLSW